MLSRRHFLGWRCYQGGIFEARNVIKSTFLRLAISSRRHFLGWQCYQDDIYEADDVIKTAFLRLEML